MRDTIDMARKAWGAHHEIFWFEDDGIEKFAALVAAAEREACAELVFNSPPSDEYESPLRAVYNAIRARGETK